MVGSTAHMPPSAPKIMFQPLGDPADRGDVAQGPLAAFDAGDPVLFELEQVPEFALGECGGPPDGPEQVAEVVGPQGAPDRFPGEEVGVR